MSLRRTRREPATERLRTLLSEIAEGIAKCHDAWIELDAAFRSAEKVAGKKVPYPTHEENHETPPGRLARTGAAS